MGSRADPLCENDRVRKIREQTTKKSPKAKLMVPSDVLLITFNLSLKQRMMEFALKCEAEPPGHANNRRQLHLFTEQKKNLCLLSSLQQTACHWCKDTEGSGTEQGNQKESTAVIKMSHECTITGNL